jgi:hypothetical protein
MSIIRAALDKLAGVLACREDQAEDVLRSEASARASFSRRGLFKAAGAVAAGVVLADAVPEDLTEGYEFRLRAYRQLCFSQPSTLRSLDTFLKERWSKDRGEALVYPKDALLSRLDKDGAIHVYTAQPGVCQYTITAVDLARGEITVSS